MPKNKNKDKKKDGEASKAEPKEPSEAVEATEASVSAQAAASKETKVEDVKKTDKEVVTEVMEKMGLAAADMSTQDKLEALCLMFKETVTENVKLKESNSNLTGQLEKNDMTKAALQKLCDALKTQVSLKDEENNLKLQEETQKRIDMTKSFEATMNELTKLVETHSGHNQSLRKENESMSQKLQELLQDFEGRDGKLSMIAEEFRLKSQLYEAQIAKAKVEKAELSTDFNKERLEMQKKLLEAQKNIDILLSREDNLKEQIELYASQYEAMAKGATDKKSQMGTFKTQVDNLNKKLKGLEADTAKWKEKFEESNEVVVRMNSAKADSDRELEVTKKKLAAMEKLNRALQTERSELLAKSKGKAEEAQNGNH